VTSARVARRWREGTGEQAGPRLILCKGTANKKMCLNPNEQMQPIKQMSSQPNEQMAPVTSSLAQTFSARCHSATKFFFPEDRRPSEKITGAVEIHLDGMPSDSVWAGTWGRGDRRLPVKKNPCLCTKPIYLLSLGQYHPTLKMGCPSVRVSVRVSREKKFSMIERSGQKIFLPPVAPC
jgi:hypothetical protein